jgi:type IV pilus assembly protein PilB
MARRLITKRIGEVLLERGLISRQQLNEALAHQQQHGGLLGQGMIQLGFVTEEDVALALTAQYGFPYLPLESYELDEAVTGSVPEHVARAYCLIPVDRIGNALTVAMADPTNVKAMEEIELMTKCVVQAFVSTPSDIQRAIDRYYNHASAPPKQADG